MEIKRIQLDHVLAHDKVLYNTNNHYNEEGIPQPEDYQKVIARGNTKNWVDKFHTNYHKFTLGRSELRWMEEALAIGLHTGRFPHSYDDEMEEACKKYEVKIPPGKWFVRTESVSLKEGMHGAGPYSDVRTIIESMVTCRPGHLAFNIGDESCTIYLFPWLDLDPNKEFRIFVYNNEITAISVQHLYTINTWLNSLSDDAIYEIMGVILAFFRKNIKEKMDYLGNYTIDLVLIDLVDAECIPYFIEPNSFGRYYSAGSALYQWVYDHDTLHDNDCIELRYVSEY